MCFCGYILYDTYIGAIFFMGHKIPELGEFSTSLPSTISLSPGDF